MGGEYCNWDAFEGIDSTVMSAELGAYAFRRPVGRRNTAGILAGDRRRTNVAECCDSDVKYLKAGQPSPQEFVRDLMHSRFGSNFIILVNLNHLVASDNIF